MISTVKLSGLLFFISFLAITNAFTQKENNSTITFTQGDRSFSINTDSERITIERKPFTIRFFGKKYVSNKAKFYTTRITVLENPTDTLQLRVGEHIDSISFFMRGTGMAPSENGYYDAAYISNQGNHYLYYESEEDKRVDLISGKKNLFEFEWKISQWNYNNEDISSDSLSLNILYFVILTDRNLNSIIDEQELKIVTISFSK